MTHHRYNIDDYHDDMDEMARACRANERAEALEWGWVPDPRTAPGPRQPIKWGEVAATVMGWIVIGPVLLLGAIAIGAAVLVPLGAVVYLLFSTIFGGGCTYAGGTC